MMLDEGLLPPCDWCGDVEELDDRGLCAECAAVVTAYQTGTEDYLHLPSDRETSRCPA